jgi:hypothetical protein
MEQRHSVVQRSAYRRESHADVPALARIIHDSSSRNRATGQARGAGLVARGKSRAFDERPSPLAPCLSPRHRRLQQKRS